MHQMENWISSFQVLWFFYGRKVTFHNILKFLHQQLKGPLLVQLLTCYDWMSQNHWPPDITGSLGPFFIACYTPLTYSFAHWTAFLEYMMNSNFMKIRRQKGKRKMKKEIKSKKPEYLLVGHQFRGLTTAERHACTWKWAKTLSCLNCRGQAHYGTGLLGVFSHVDHCEAF